MKTNIKSEYIYVGITDTDWYHFIADNHKSKTLNEYVNFWTPGKKNFKALKEGELFLFKLHNNAKNNEHGEIVGGGYFYKYDVSDTIGKALKDAVVEATCNNKNA